MTLTIYLVIGAIVGVASAVAVKVTSDNDCGVDDDLFGFVLLGAIALFGGFIWPLVVCVSLFAFAVKIVSGLFQKGEK